MGVEGRESAVVRAEDDDSRPPSRRVATAPAANSLAAPRQNHPDGVRQRVAVKALGRHLDLSEARAPPAVSRSGAGAHQLQLPNSRMVAGTSNNRTSVASIATASAIPKPTARMTTILASVNAANTTIMMAAALVMSPAVFSSPSATASVLSCVRS